jgi:hypothetical protein
MEIVRETFVVEATREFDEVVIPDSPIVLAEEIKPQISTTL